MARLNTVLCVALALMVSGCSCRSKVAGGTTDISTGADATPLKDINFAFDSSSLDGNAKAILGSNAEWLKANPNSKVEVEGHCDERGTNQYNMALGARRAQSAFDYLATLGVEKSRMSTVSYGEELPLENAHNEAAWAKNRRDHFNVK